MAYLGRGIENLSDRVVLDSLTASATASYTIQLNSVNFVPSSAESLTVSLNGVIQNQIVLILYLAQRLLLLVL